MKKNYLAPLIIFLLILPNLIIAQVKGNKEIVTRTFPIKNIESITINFYAEVIIDCSELEGMSITTDSNLFDLIQKDMDGTELKLDQKEWISPSRKAEIRIGAPMLKKLTTGTHDLTKVINIDNDYFQVLSPVGEVQLQGKTKEFNLEIKLAKVDASQLVAENANINIWSRGSAKIAVLNELDVKLDEDAKLELVNEPKSLKGDINKLKKTNNPEKRDESIVYIDFKIKNNSANRRNFFVIGPKPDGEKFSYGFPMMPLATRDERWTTGTKIYKVNSMGLRELLVTISAEDENQTVKLFE